MKLFWLLCAWLLLAGTVEAGEMKLPPTITGLKYNGETLLTCDEHYQSCAGPMIEQSSCYQRMQEAMQAMNAYRPVVDRYGNIVAFEGFDGVKSDAIYAIKQWDRVMRECVQ